MEDLDEDHVQELHESKEVQEILQVMRNHTDGQEKLLSGSAQHKQQLSDLGYLING